MKGDRFKSEQLKNLALLPLHKPIACLLRHAEREPFLPGDLGNDVDLTHQGQASCHLLARIWEGQLRKVYSSPVKRCLQTAELLVGSAIDTEITRHSYLGDPGIFITDPAKAQIYFQQQDIIDIVKHLLNPMPNGLGFCDSTFNAAALLMQWMLGKSGLPGIHVFITHDAILSILLGYVFHDFAIETLWPHYLEGLFLWQTKHSFYGIYRGVGRPIPWLTKC